MDKRKQVGALEIFGYILVFVMVSFLLSVVYMEAMPRISNYEDYANFKVMEGEFMVLRDVVMSVSSNVTPKKVVNLNVKRGVVYIDHVGNMSLYDGVSTYNYELSALVYKVGNNKIYLVLGSVVDCFGEDCVVIVKPPFSEKYAQIINISGYLAFTGARSLFFYNEGSELYENVSINVTFRNESLAKEFNKSIGGFSEVDGVLSFRVNGMVRYCNVLIS